MAFPLRGDLPEVWLYRVQHAPVSHLWYHLLASGPRKTVTYRADPKNELWLMTVRMKLIVRRVVMKFGKKSFTGFRKLPTSGAYLGPPANISL